MRHEQVQYSYVYALRAAAEVGTSETELIKMRE